MIVVDTSVVVDCFLSKDIARAYAELIKLETVLAPDHIYCEVLHVLRRLERYGDISSIYAEHCVTALETMNISTRSIKSMVQETWILRHNITPYDAPFVVLAGELDCTLLTNDERLANAARDHITVKSLLPAP